MGTKPPQNVVVALCPGDGLWMFWRVALRPGRSGGSDHPMDLRTVVVGQDVVKAVDLLRREHV